METVRALRGVCIGVERHLKPGETAALDAATAQHLVGIGAVVRVEPEPVNPEPVKTPAKKEK